ncbi:TetR/AcrR family transcriptional regulator [Amycolatopsis benzoatilytica]|uniref:TetR/AcrR family transcriptional regulator n=1 Tax=Amycolatopsis benzoatilytica TaxID=346045 RepID=UPI00036FD947|nr:TetR/AcrR family transcriptional regulator [Amycolatopsis benzoatilytica]
MSDVKPMRADARRNYERLLVEARRAFAERGVDASLEDVARSAGVGIGTLYRHFPTRDDLIEALLRDRFDTQAAKARELLAAEDPLDALYAWLVGFGATSSSYRGLTELLADAIDDPRSRLHASCEEMQTAASHLVDRAQKAGVLRADLTVRELLLLLHGASWGGTHLPGDGGTERLLSLVFTGLRASEQRGQRGGARAG